MIGHVLDTGSGVLTKLFSSFGKLYLLTNNQQNNNSKWEPMNILCDRKEIWTERKSNGLRLNGERHGEFPVVFIVVELIWMVVSRNLYIGLLPLITYPYGKMHRKYICCSIDYYVFLLL